MRRIKLHRIVEYLKQVDFYHDTFDIEEMGIEDILCAYGGFGNLTDEELQEIKKDIYRLAERNEFKEAGFLAEYGMIEDFAIGMRSRIETGSVR